MANNFKARADESKPREKMMNAPTLRDLSSADLLAVLLKTGAAGCDVLTLAERLISLFGSTRKFVAQASDWRNLKERIRLHNKDGEGEKILGVGDVKLLELAAAFELARRGFGAEDEPDDGGMPESIRSVEDAVAAFRIAMRGRAEQENFFVLPVNLKFAPLSEPVCITRGSIASTPVHAREVFREAVRWGAHAIAVAHNHPSGDPTPSRSDIQLTRRLLDVSRDIGIPLIDHIIVGTAGAAGKFVSMRRSGIVSFEKGTQGNGN